MDQKSKNKYLVAATPFLLGKTADLRVGTKSYETEVIEEDGIPVVVTKDIVDILNAKATFKAMPGETKEQLVDRFNKKALMSED